MDQPSVLPTTLSHHQRHVEPYGASHAVAQTISRSLCGLRPGAGQSAGDGLGSDPRWKRIDPPPGTDLWTDDFSNILGVLN